MIFICFCFEDLIWLSKGLIVSDFSFGCYLFDLEFMIFSYKVIFNFDGIIGFC